MLKLADLAVREDFSLGPLWVSPALRLIKGPAGELHVEPLTMQVLLVLADANGRVVTRDRLYDECWGGVNVGDYSLNRAITMVRRIAVETAPGAFRIESIPRTGYRLLVNGLQKPTHVDSSWRLRYLPIAGVIVTALLAAGATAWFLRDHSVDEPTVAIDAAQDSRSAELSRKIANAAITTAATYGAPLRLLDGPGATYAKANFILRVRASQVDRASRIDLTLVSGPDKAVLWSWYATQPATEADSLDQLAGDTGGLVLACAAETRSGGSRPPDQNTTKLYLGACSKLEPWAGAELQLLADSFEKVTASAPQFRGAWSKLFLSKAEAIEGFPPVDLVDGLKHNIEESVARGIDLPETYIAKAALLAPNTRFERLALYEAGLARYPRSPYLLAARSWQLRSVGRMDEAARTARRLVELYPQSSAANTEYVQSLMSSGRVDAARSILERGAKSAPGAANLEGVRWRLEMRYGDPKTALAIARSGRSVVDSATITFLEARINPTKETVDRAVDDLMAKYRADPREPGLVAQALGGFGRTDEAIRFLLQYPLGATSGDGAEMLFRPHMQGIRRDARFILIAKNFGLTKYWLKSGILPDFCYEPRLPYDCRQELAKLQN